MTLLSNLFDPAREAALVTGAGNGIGRAIAQALVGEGVRTVFADVREDTVVGAAAGSPRPDLATAWVGDLARRDACDALLAHARSSVGQVTLFVHSAAPPRREVDHALAVTKETWEQMRAVNVDAGFHLARELARQLIAAREPGSFLMVTSLHADTPRNLPHYSTAKAALAILVKELAKTLGRFGIRVNALVPGAIAAGGFVADPSMARHIPLGRLGRSEDLAPMALALLSNRVSAYVTGAAVVVDGGISLTNWFDPPVLDEGL
jgi:3-oxoacyl-[acyl-carrier protein] reductase